MIPRYLMIGLLTLAALVRTQAQQSLSDLVGEAKAEWMFGQWEAQTDNGGTFTLKVSWDLDKHVVVLHGKGGEMELKGYSVLEPGTSQVKYIGFDNRGAVTKGAWGMEGEELVLRAESTVPEGSSRKTAFVFAGTPSEGLQIRIHQVSGSGDLVTPARITLKFKKQK
jgi:hypothetical protein